jgi:hypothetical protein
MFIFYLIVDTNIGVFLCFGLYVKQISQTTDYHNFKYTLILNYPLFENMK